MREIIFDTETTGLDCREDRIIEIGAIEFVNRFATGRTLHLYIHPGNRPIHPDAQAVHGISLDFLSGKPAFDSVGEEIREFFHDAHLVAHNAAFDIGFVNAEFARLGFPSVEPDRIIDTLALARRRHPMGPNSLDALCRRYGVDNSHRTRHGALLDAELLADVYLEMSGGRQAALGFEQVQVIAIDSRETETVVSLRPRARPLASRLTPEESAAHRRLVAGLGEKAVWLDGTAAEA